MISRVAAVMVKDEGTTLSEAISGLGVSKVTTIKWLRAMERDGLLYRSYDMKPGKRGRPRSVYNRTKNLKRFMEGSNDGSMVSLSFKSLKSVCRYEKGGMCKAILPKLQRCEPSLCPYLKPRSD